MNEWTHGNNEAVAQSGLMGRCPCIVDSKAPSSPMGPRYRVDSVFSGVREKSWGKQR